MPHTEDNSEEYVVEEVLQTEKCTTVSRVRYALQLKSSNYMMIIMILDVIIITYFIPAGTTITATEL